MAKPKPTLLRRQREQKRNQKKMEKARKKAERAEERTSSKDKGGGEYEDPDIAGIVPGPQPILDPDDLAEGDATKNDEKSSSANG